MPRPARPLWKTRRYARHRHRVWMYSMTLASLGWACWWSSLLWRHFAPGSAPSLATTGWAADAFATVGLVLAFLTVRATRTWLLFVLAAVFANASLLFLPWLLEDLARQQ